jgi:hypothetical protein
MKPTIHESNAQSLLGVRPELVGSVSFGGLRAYCVGYAIDTDADDHVIYLSMVGYRTAVRGVWAALLENHALEIAGQLFRRAEGTYLHRSVPLPETNLEHMVLLHHQAAVSQVEPNQLCYLLNESGEPPYARFFAMLNRAVAAPMLPEWAGWLWQEGEKEGLIQSLTATRGTNARRVQADEAEWLALIQSGVRSGKLTSDNTGGVK